MNKEQTLEFLSKAADLHASDIFIIAGRPLCLSVTLLLRQILFICIRFGKWVWMRIKDFTSLYMENIRQRMGQKGKDTINSVYVQWMMLQEKKFR